MKKKMFNVFILLLLALFSLIFTFSCKEDDNEELRKKQEEAEKKKAEDERKSPMPEYCVLDFNYIYEGQTYLAICFKSVPNAYSYSFYFKGFNDGGMEIPKAYVVKQQNPEEAESKNLSASSPALKDAKNAANCDKAYLRKLWNDGSNITNYGVSVTLIGKEESDVKWSEPLTKEQQDKL